MSSDNHHKVSVWTQNSRTWAISISSFDVALINSLFISSNDCLAEIKIVAMNAANKTCTKTTHWKPLCAALFDPSMEQVMTISWDH